MLKYVIIGALVAGLTAWLVVRYVPSGRDYKAEAAARMAMADSLMRANELIRQAKQDKTDFLAAVQQAQQRSDEQAALVLSAIRLQVQSLSAFAQRNEVVQRGLVRGLITPKDTLGPQVITYTQPENQATLAQLRECDATEQRLRITLESLSLATRRSEQTTDSLQKALRWIGESKAIEAWPGIPILTGENKMQRAHVKTSPFAPQ